ADRTAIVDADELAHVQASGDSTGRIALSDRALVPADESTNDTSGGADRACSVGLVDYPRAEVAADQPARDRGSAGGAGGIAFGHRALVPTDQTADSSSAVDVTGRVAAGHHPKDAVEPDESADLAP